MRSRTFESFAGTAAIAVAAGSLGYAVAFVTILRRGTKAADTASNLILLLGGIVTTAVLIAVYERVRDTDAGFALWGLVLGVTGSLGSAVHGGFELANLANPPARVFKDLPNPVDPRGLLTFGLTALALLLFSWLIVRGGALPRGLGYLGYVAGVLLIVVYVGRLTILNPKSPGLLTAAVLSGFLVNPAWFIWTGIELRRGTRAEPEMAPRPSPLSPGGPA